MGLTLSTIGNQVWSKLRREGTCNLFSEAMPQLCTIFGTTPGSQQLGNFKKATLQFPCCVGWVSWCAGLPAILGCRRVA